jgi:deoxyribodipyrimidine photo-lyase
VLQGRKFDPDGAYLHRYVPELWDVPHAQLHDPWNAPRPPAGYPAPIVDHADRRAEALRRYEVVKGQGASVGRGVLPF